MHVYNKNSNNQGRSPNVVKVIFQTIRNCSGSEFFPLRVVPILKRDAIEVNHCLVQYSPFDVRTFSAFWLRRCKGIVQQPK